MAAWYT